MSDESLSYEINKRRGFNELNHIANDLEKRPDSITIELISALRKLRLICIRFIFNFFCDINQPGFTFIAFLIKATMALMVCKILAICICFTYLRANEDWLAYHPTKSIASAKLSLLAVLFPVLSWYQSQVAFLAWV